MEVEVKRVAKRDSYTVGKVYVNGTYVCDSIEDKDRGLTQDMSLDKIKTIKVKDKTAIPTGKYRLTLSVQSPTFGKKVYYKNFCNGYLPRILDVPGFDGILMHRGVDENSSSGCIILGYNKVVGKVINSLEAFEKFYKILKKATDKIYINIH